MLPITGIMWPSKCDYNTTCWSIPIYNNAIYFIVCVCMYACTRASVSVRRVSCFFIRGLIALCVVFCLFDLLNKTEANWVFEMNGDKLSASIIYIHSRTRTCVACTWWENYISIQLPPRQQHIIVLCTSLNKWISDISYNTIYAILYIQCCL